MKLDVIAIPTETVYGLAAPIDRPDAIEEIFRLKGRPKSNPIIVHVANRNQVESLTSSLPPGSESLMDAFWPGPLTLILPASEIVPEIVRAGLPTVGIRMPLHPLTLELIRVKGPLVAPSANLSGKPSATRPEHIRADFGEDFPLIDGGPCAFGLESTILIYESEWHIAREGAISAEQLIEVLGYRPSKMDVRCPGSKHKHYSPKAEITTELCETVVGYTDRNYEALVYALGASTNPHEIAKNFYDVLRKLDIDGVKRAQIDISLPVTGLYSTIHERIGRVLDERSRD